MELRSMREWLWRYESESARDCLCKRVGSGKFEEVRATGHFSTIENSVNMALKFHCYISFCVYFEIAL
jgi:hypothetical protein